MSDVIILAISFAIGWALGWAIYRLWVNVRYWMRKRKEPTHD